MAILKNSLEKMVNKILEKEQKIKDKISELESSIEQSEQAIQDKYDSIVDFELDENATGSASSKREIAKLERQVKEQKHLLRGYCNKLTSSLASEEELEKIRLKALEEQEEFSEARRKIIDKKEQIELKIKALKDEAESLSIKADRLEDPSKKAVSKILKHIEPLAEKLSYTRDREHFAESWMHQADLDQILCSRRLKEKPIEHFEYYEAPFDPEEAKKKYEKELREIDY